MARLRPRNKPVSSGFTNSEIKKMEKLLKQSVRLSLGREFCQMIAADFNHSAGHTGKPAVDWTEIQSWFLTRLQDSLEVPKDLEFEEGKNIQNTSELKFEARSSIDGAWYDVDKFLAYRFCSTSKVVSSIYHDFHTLQCGSTPEVCIRFVGFGAEEDEWVNIKNAVRERSVPLDNKDCRNLKPGDQVLCFQERKDRAIHYDAHIMKIERKMHDVRGCRCLFLIQYDHDDSEESVRLKRMCRRPRS
ncbi:hypothetical protein PIB30_090736 [Stylosanthes scabra]|uniref:SAWADEE domain-containing protein n=1 Tax=Stylosanthes scabra TaxID=79078 RepID=A0ABU6TUY3_9FABA|nr:hypothetical protein [Stylosanthes scabra]